jgi:hypothetical protein
VEHVEVRIQIVRARKLQIQTAEWRSWVSRDEGGSVKAGSAICALVIKDHAHERLYATDEQAPIFKAVFVIQRDYSLE